MGSKAPTQPAPPSEAFAVKAGESRHGKTLHVVGDEIAVKISSQDTGGAFAVVEGSSPVGGGPPLHKHDVQHEWWHILEGQFLFEVDGREMYAGPGDTVFAPCGSCHAFQNVGA